MIKIIENHLWLRRCLAKIITKSRRSKKIRPYLLRLVGYENDVWQGNKSESSFKSLYDVYKVDFNQLKQVVGRTKIGLIALKSEGIEDSFIQACKELEIDYEIYDPIDEEFINKVIKSDVKKFLVRPSHKTQHIRQMFFEKIEMIVSALNVTVYPTIIEQKIYEAKRSLAYFLQLHDIPHPKTHIFYSKHEAIQFSEKTNYPKVFKTTNGAGASGVEILKNKKQAIKLIKACFDGYYLNKSVSDYRDIDYGYIILQDFIQNAREHRVIKIGDSWMGHEKAFNENSEFMSGSGVNLWVKPKFEVLEFCRKLAETHKFTTMCFDVFEDENGSFFINELQTWFGSYNPSQMYIDDIPGRYIFLDGEYVFEKGLFNHNNSMNLKLIDIINGDNHG